VPENLALQLAVSHYSKDQVRHLLGKPDRTDPPFEDWDCDSTYFYWLGPDGQSSAYFGFDRNGRFKRYFYAP